MKNPIFGEKTEAVPPTAKISIPTLSTPFRPYLSLTGPKTICPRPRPIMPKERPSCTVETLQPKVRVISGSAGMYISFTKEPNMLSTTMNMIKNQ